MSRPPRSSLFPYTTLFRSATNFTYRVTGASLTRHEVERINLLRLYADKIHAVKSRGDRKSTRLNSSHVAISYAVFCLKKKIYESTTTCRVVIEVSLMYMT